MASTSRGKANVDTVEPKTETVCPVHNSTKSRLRHSDTDPDSDRLGRGARRSTVKPPSATATRPQVGWAARASAR